MIVRKLYKVLNIHWFCKLHSSDVLPVMLVKLNRITVPLWPLAVYTAPENHRCHAVSNRMYYRSYGY